MSVASGATLAGRAHAEALMESTCVVVRQTGTSTSVGGVDTPAFTTIYTGKCRLRMIDTVPRGVAAAGQALEHQYPVLSLPVTASGSDDVAVGDRATVTGSSLDPSVVVVRIAGIHIQTHSTARRFPVEVTA